MKNIGNNILASYPRNPRVRVDDVVKNMMILNIRGYIVLNKKDDKFTIHSLIDRGTPYRKGICKVVDSNGNVVVEVSDPQSVTFVRYYKLAS